MTTPSPHAPPLKGRINHSIAHWCLETVGWSLAQMIDAAHELGVKSIELVDPADWPALKAANLTCAIALNGMEGPPFVKGLNNLAYHEEVIGNTRSIIDACAQSEGVCTQVLAFTGYKYRDAEDPTSGEISQDEGADNTVTGLRTLGEYAARHGVTISIEQLNTRDDTHPMKGHPGYQGDDIDYVAGIVQRVNLPNVRLLFDIYHVQIMHGDIIRRIRQYADLIGHVHTAGNPGRAELHLSQEIGYTAIMEALAETGYTGYVGHEFIPTQDPMEGLRQAVAICDV
jgi:sugar phosphate isomerase/epimerase